MFKPEELVPREVWTVVLSKLSTGDELSCRCVCLSFKKEVDSIFNKNHDRLWLRHRDNDYAHYLCYDKEHRISSRDTLYFDKIISIKNLKFVSKLMPSLKILQLDPLDQVYREDYKDSQWDESFPDYRDKKGIAVPITKIFPQVSCLILPGATEKKNFTGHLSQVKHVTLFDGVRGESPAFPNLDSLEAQKYSTEYDNDLPMPSKRFVAPHGTIEWRTLPKTLEVIEARLIFDEYISLGKPHFENLKILKDSFSTFYAENQNLETLINFLKDHNESLTELSFSAIEEVANIKVLLPLFTRLHKLSVQIATDKQAIELKEVKDLAHNLQYFELSINFWCRARKNLGAILGNLPTGLDNLLIEGVGNSRVNKMDLEKIIEKVLNGDTKTVTIAGLEDTSKTRKTIEKIVKMKPESVRVEKRNIRVREECGDNGNRTDIFRSIFDIVITL